MNKIKALTLDQAAIPRRLQTVVPPPRRLFVLGESLSELLSRPCLAVVGSRKVSGYGRMTTLSLVEAVAREGVVIISGLALGVDGLAHQAALNAGTPTIAVLPCGIDAVYPRSHYQLAQRIIAGGGVLLSEYPEHTAPMKHHFIARNRLISGMADATLITEAAEKSGSLHTAGFTLEQGREVLAVPGNINSPLSKGTNNLIRSGATPVTCADDVLDSLGVATRPAMSTRIVGANADEHAILSLLQTGISDGDELLLRSKLSATVFNRTLTMLEVNGRIKPLGAGQWTL